MANQDKDTLKGYFQTGDIPTEAQFADLIDSNLNSVDDLLDEDDFSSDSATKVPSQQSTKAYVDDNASLFSATETYQIPTDYATLQGAIDALTKKRQNKASVEIILNIESGHQPASGIDVANGDYSKFRITSTDAEVTVSNSFTGPLINCEYGVAPTLDTIFDMNGFGTHGYRCAYSSRGYITSGSGIRRSGDKSIYAHQGSIINAQGAVVTDCQSTTTESVGATRGSLIVLNFATVTGGLQRGVVCVWGSTITARQATITGHAEQSVLCVDSSLVNIFEADVTGSSGALVQAEGASFVNAEGVTATGSGTPFFVSGGSIINANDASYTVGSLEPNLFSPSGLLLDESKGLRFESTGSSSSTNAAAFNEDAPSLTTQNTDNTDNNYGFWEHRKADGLSVSRIVTQVVSQAGRQAKILFLNSKGSSPDASAEIDENGNFLPSLNATYDLGLGGKRWNNVYIQNSLDTPNLTIDTNGNIDSGGDIELTKAGTQTNPAATANNSAVISQRNSSNTNNNFTSLDGYNSNNLVNSRFITQYTDHAGRIARYGWYLSNGSSPSAKLFLEANGNLTPASDNTQQLGTGSLRWSEVFAGTGTINTSDERQKEIRGSLTESELKAWDNVRTVVYQWKDSVEEKGEDARLHVGFIAQQVKKSFEDQGLDPFRYGLLCKDEVFEEVKKERKETRLVQKTELVKETTESIEIIDGQPILKTVTEEVEKPIFNEKEVVDEQGNIVYNEVPEFDEYGKPITDDDGKQSIKKVALTHKVPVYEEVEETVYDIEKVSLGDRYGLRYSECLAFECAYLRSMLESNK